MHEIRITDDQADRLQGVQESLRREVVGKYGHVRPRDAIEYLLDCYEDDSTGDGDDPSVAAGPDGAIGSDPDVTADDAGADAASETASDDPSTETTAEDADVGDTDGGDAAEEATDGSADPGLVGRGAATARVVTGDDDVGDAADDDSGMLDSVMNLAHEHDDKWREADAGEERYVVELPDGTTEPARTKDDVRALLFKHYR